MAHPVGDFAGTHLRRRFGQNHMAGSGQRQHRGCFGGQEPGMADQSSDLSRCDAALEGSLGLAGPEPVVMDASVTVRSSLGDLLR